jgi:hypothetical protein
LYEPPQIANVSSYLNGSLTNVDSAGEIDDEENNEIFKTSQTSKVSTLRSSIQRSLCFPLNEEHTRLSDFYDEELEERLNFIETLRFAYHKQIEEGK